MIKNVDNRKKSKPEHNGIKFDSDMEMRFYKEVIEPASEDGTIVDLVLQKKYTLLKKIRSQGKAWSSITYTPDFEFTAPCGLKVFIDVKGMVKPEASLRRHMFIRFPEVVDGKWKLWWVAYSKIDGGWVDVERIKRGRNKRRKRKKEKGAK